MPERARPVEAVLLVHGAMTGPSVFAGWEPFFPGVRVSAVDLQLGLRVEVASMDHYAGTLVAEAGRHPFPLAVCGWGMGGLVALMTAELLRPHRLVLLEPDPPAEVRGFHPEVEPTDGLDLPDPGVLDPRLEARPDSRRARLERERGVSVPRVPVPTLVVFGDRAPEERGRAVARRYGVEELVLPGLGHADLVLDPDVPRAVARWLGLTADR
ncbi:MAG TPA: alpha/beta fold hydrolase [Actinomycetota bacterium]|nr:alpha/beta fold hydrolase [Actinomycetota bacterium]